MLWEDRNTHAPLQTRGELTRSWTTPCTNSPGEKLALASTTLNTALASALESPGVAMEHEQRREARNEAREVPADGEMRRRWIFEMHECSLSNAAPMSSLKFREKYSGFLLNEW
jgi:hypothetical protein